MPFSSSLVSVKGVLNYFFPLNCWLFQLNGWLFHWNLWCFFRNLLRLPLPGVPRPSEQLAASRFLFEGNRPNLAVCQ